MAAEPTKEQLRATVALLFGVFVSISAVGWNASLRTVTGPNAPRWASPAPHILMTLGLGVALIGLIYLIYSLRFEKVTAERLSWSTAATRAAETSTGATLAMVVLRLVDRDPPTLLLTVGCAASSFVLVLLMKRFLPVKRRLQESQ